MTIKGLGYVLVDGNNVTNLTGWNPRAEVPLWKWANMSPMPVGVQAAAAQIADIYDKRTRPD